MRLGDSPVPAQNANGTETGQNVADEHSYDKCIEHIRTVFWQNAPKEFPPPERQKNVVKQLNNSH